MELIALYAPDAADFSTLGLGALTPSECTVSWQAAGAYELTLVQPIDETNRWAQLANGCIISAPVPVRESPLYEYGVGDGGSGSVTRNIWQVARTTVGLYMRTGYGTGYKALRHYPNGTQVVELDRQTVGGRLWIHCTTVVGGETGYMSTKYLDLVETKTETISDGRPESQRVIQLTQSRRQLFRIYSTEQDSDAGVVTVKARHVFYDLTGNMLNGDYSPENVPGAEAVRQVFARLKNAGDFSVYTEGLTKGSVTGEYGYKNPVEILLDPDDGIVHQCECQIIRDNFDVHLLDDIESDMGVTVRRGKNLVGVTVTTDDSDVVTQIKPCGKDADGNDFWLTDAESDERYVNSAHSASYPVTRTVKRDYDVSLVKRDEDNETTFRDNTAGRTAARAKLKALAEQDFADGADLPTYGMDVDFVLLQGADGDAQYAGLQAVHPYDTVTVADSMLGLTAKLRVTGYEWNALTGQYDSVTLGDIQALAQTMYSYNLPTGGVSGTKIAPGTASGSILRDATIQYAKISVAAIEQLSAEAIVALTAHIDEIVAGEITTDALYAAFAELIALKAGTITADNITTDSLAAELARITVLSCGSATFDKATIQHLVAEAMNLEYGVAGQVFIKNLAVEYAQMVGATIGNLCIKASDGNYYSIDVDADGNVSATKTTVSDSDISAGQFISQKDIFSSENAQTGYVNSSGVFSPTSGYTTYGYFEIGEGVVYTVNSELPSDTYGYIRVAYYDANKNFLLREMSEAKAKSYSSTTPSGCAYVRISMEVAYTDIQLFVPAETRVILETNITAANLNTSNLLATYALINKIDAARIDVAELFAQSAFVDALYTSKIYGDKSIEMIVGQVNQNAEDIANLDSLDIYTGNTPPAAPLAEGKLWIDTGVSPTVIRRWRGLDVSTDREYSIAGSAFSLSTIDAYFTISNGSGTSGWALSANSSAGVNLAPGNIGVNSSTATVTLKAVRDLSNVVITGAYYTETNYDKLTLTVAGTTVLNAVSGTSARAQRFSGSIASGKEIVLKYVKDVSTSATNEANTLFTITSSDTVPAGYTASGWDTISDTQEIERILGQVEQTAESAQDAASSAQNTAASAQDAAESAKSTADSALPRVEFQRVVRIDDEGLHVGDNQSNGEVLVDSNSVNVVFNGQKYSKFSGNYVQFGNYQLRRSSDGGLVFKLA